MTRNALKYVAAVGMFDGVHSGHRSILSTLVDEARKKNMGSIVLSFKNHPHHLLRPGEAPGTLTLIDDRRQMILDEGVDRVEFLDFTPELQKLTAREFLAMIRSKWNIRELVVGFNNRIGSDRVDASTAALLSPETGVEIIPASEHKIKEHPCVSSSAVREALLKGNVQEATSILGHPYSLRGKVIHGHALGRTLGFPTANISPVDPHSVIPAPGVYAVDAHIEGFPEKFRAITNIGRRPTLTSSDASLSIETHILDFHHQIYDSEIRITFLSRLRDEKKFPSPEELKKQIAIDAHLARNL